MSHQRVLLADTIGEALLFQAVREGLARIDPDRRPRRHGRRVTQDALSLLLLADELIMPVGKGLTSDIPLLTDSGIMTIIEFDVDDPPSGVDPWTSFLESYECIRPFVLSKVVALRHGIDTCADLQYARRLGLSRRAFYDLLIQCMAAVYSKSFSSSLASYLVHGGLRVEVLKDMEADNRITEFMVDALFSTLIFTALVDLSMKTNASLASGDYGRIHRSWFKTAPVENAMEQLQGLSILRTSIRDSGGRFPEIEGIRHAIQLRQDPSVKSLRRFLKDFHGSVAAGEAIAAREAAEAVAAASTALRKAHHWGDSLRWVTYAALPVGIAEALLAGSGYLGIAFSLYSVVGTFAQDWAQRRHGWFLFGSNASTSQPKTN